jgi:hypothetical protein
VHHGDNKNFIRIDSVEKPKWETMNEPTADLQADNRPFLGIIGNIINSQIDFIQKICPKTTRLHFIEARRIQHLQLGRKKKTDDLFHLMEQRASRRTSFAERAGILPFRNPLYLRSASSIHNCSFSDDSKESRLEMRCSARIARSFGGNFRALASHCFKSGDIVDFPFLSF